jgi:hypothetical protein
MQTHRTALRGIAERYAMAATADRTSSRITLFGIALIWLLAQMSLAVAHDSWINRGGYRHAAGEWCCGDNDCEPPGPIVVTGKGWGIGGTEFVTKAPR